MGCYLKCVHFYDNDHEHVSLYYHDNDGEEQNYNNDFMVFNRYNAIISTPICINNNNGIGKIQKKSLESALNCFSVNVQEVKLLDVENLLYGLNKVNENIKFIRNKILNLS